MRLKHRIFIAAATAALIMSGGSIARSAQAAPSEATAAPQNIAPTPETANDPSNNVVVFGSPRQAVGHPCTLWDTQDVERYKALLASDPQFKEMFGKLVGKMNDRITKPLNVPEVHQGPDGKWIWPGDFPADEPPHKNLNRTSSQNGADMVSLGQAYALTGDAKYAEFCRRMVMAYADNYSRWGRPPSPASNWRFARDHRLSHQFLNDGFIMIQMAFAYDLIHDLPTFSAQDHAKIRDGLFREIAKEFYEPNRENQDYLSLLNNRSVLCAAAVLVAGYATEDQGLINDALYGHGGTWEKPVGGALSTHFGPEGILPDGLWVEGAPGYQLQIAGSGLFDIAEVMWRHGVDLYAYRNGILKRMLDSGLYLANPNPALTVPCLHDSGPFSLLDQRDWLNGEIATDYELGYQRYHDPRYIPIIQNGATHLALTVHSGPPSLFLTLPSTQPTSEIKTRNVNFYSTGYGILRIGHDQKIKSLILEYGPSGSHGHPSKLGIDLYAFGDTLMPFPGVIFPYDDPLDTKWFWTTTSNSVLQVDQTPQIFFANLFKFKGAALPAATQLVYGPGATLGIERASSKTVNPGVTLDRSLFLTQDYLVDLFAATSATPHTYDLIWHVRGGLETQLPLAPWSFPKPVPDGYNALDHIRHGATDQPWSAEAIFHNKPVRFLSAGGMGTEVIIGDGYFDARKERPPTVIQRRINQTNTLFGNAVDLSGNAEAYIKGITQEGGPDAGYGMLKIQTPMGTDLCFASYRPGKYSVAGLETDAAQAIVLMDGLEPAAAYLGGGNYLRVGPFSIERSQPGLAAIERIGAEDYIVSNPSPTEATITVTFTSLDHLKAFNLDSEGNRSHADECTTSEKSVTLRLPPTAKVEFSKVGH